MKDGFADVLSTSQAKLFKRPAFRQRKPAFGIDGKEDYGSFSDDPAQVLFGVA